MALQQTRSVLQRKQFTAATNLSTEDQKNVAILLRMLLHELHSQGESDDQPLNEIEQAVNAMLQELPWCKGAEFTPEPVRKWDERAVELQSDELLLLAAGEKLPHSEELENLDVPLVPDTKPNTQSNTSQAKVGTMGPIRRSAAAALDAQNRRFGSRSPSGITGDILISRTCRISGRIATLCSMDRFTPISFSTAGGSTNAGSWGPFAKQADFRWLVQQWPSDVGCVAARIACARICFAQAWSLVTPRIRIVTVRRLTRRSRG